MIVRDNTPFKSYDYPIYTAWSYISMHSLIPEYLAALRFDGTQAATLRALGEYQGKQQPGGRWKATNNELIERHPDGNGRMSRLLTLLLLYHFDYTVGRYISLERIFEDTREGSRNAFEASSQGWHQGQHEVKPWLDYFWGALLRAYCVFEERVGTIERGRGSKGDRVRAEVLGRSQPFSTSEIEEACPGVSRDMVRLVLRAMKAEGLIESTGKGRGARWKRITAAGLDSTINEDQ